MNNSTKIVIYCKKSYNKNNTIFVNEKNFQISPLSIESIEQSLEFLENMQNSSIMGKTILELFQYDDSSFWWFLHPSLFPIIKQAINFITKFDEFLDEIKPSVVKVTEDFQTFEIISQLCKIKKIPLEYSKKDLLQFKTVKKIILQGQKYRYKKIFSTKLKERKNLFYHSKHKNSLNLQDKFVFAVPTIYRRSILNLKTGKSEKGEYVQQTVMDLIKNKGKIFGIDVDYTFKGDFGILSERLESDMIWAPLEIFIKKNREKKVEHKEFLKKYKKIITSNQFKKLFEFKDISIWDQIAPTLLKMTYAPHFPFYLNLIDSIAELLLEEKPKAIFLTYETGPMALPLIIVAQRYGIKTVSLAHAPITKSNPMYSICPLRDINSPLGFPTPDFSLVFGNSSKNSLINQGYPKEKIIAFGNAAFFNLADFIQILASRPLYQKYNLKKDQKVILFTTGYLQEYHITHGKYNYDTQILLHLIENFSNQKDFIIILKPHPSENTELYEKIIKKHNATNFRIIQGNLFEMIYVSDVVVSVYSYSMIDAICFNKPVIRVSFDNVEHITPYDKFEVVISCELQALSKEIKNVLVDETLKEKLSKNRDAFIKEEYNIPEHNPELVLYEILEI